MATYEELMAKARALAADGRAEDAKRVAQIAVGMNGQDQPADIKPNPDGTYGQPPEGIVYNPNTGQMTSRELLANNMYPNAATSAAVGAQQGLSFGFGDEVQGALNAASMWRPGTAGERYAFGREQMRAMEDAARRDNPGATTAGELGGALATSLMPLGAGARGAQVAGRAAQVAPRVAQTAAAARANLPLLTRMGGSAAAGAGMGGLYGFGAGEGGLGPRVESARNAGLLSGGVGAFVPIVGAGVQKGLNARAARGAIRDAAKGAPTSEELRAMGKAAYKQVDDAGVYVKPTSTVRMYGDIAESLSGEGANLRAAQGANSPIPGAATAYSAAKQMAEEAAQKPEISFSELDMARRFFGNNAASTMKAGAGRGAPDDTRIATEAFSKVDDFVNRLGPDDVLAGDAEALKTALPKAREAWARMSRSQLVDDAISAGSGDNGFYLSGGASGIRNQFARILRDPKLSRGFSDAEKAALSRVVRGSGGASLLHNLGSGIGQIASTGTGAALGTAIPVPGLGPVLGATVGAGVGQTFRKGSEALARRDAELARAAIASGKLPLQLPSADPAKRAIIEQLLRGNLAVAGGNLPR